MVKFMDILLGRSNPEEETKEAEPEIDTKQIEASLEESQTELDMALAAGAAARQSKRSAFKDATEVVKEVGTFLSLPHHKPVPSD